ncbi:tetratricopeptide repeat protein [Chitinophaga sp.]|uniref:tetratricopeptide repeat protein n=1 Tax=Chitinophaga sp. TaxID=1869181 RepID=UPI002F9511BB
MDEMNEEAQAPVKKTGCHNCVNPETEPGYLTPLCRECRKQLSRYPVLNSVKWAAAGVALLFLISAYNLPRYLKAGVTYQRALKAENTHHYVTEKKLLEKVLQQFPDNFEAGAHYIIASYNNDEPEVVDSMLEKMSGKQNENQDLINKVNDVLDGFRYLKLIDTSFAASLSKLDEKSPEYEQALNTYCSKRYNDVCARFMLGSYAYNQGNYAKADSVLSKLVQETPDFRYAMLWLANTYREEKQYDKAIRVYNDILLQNAEASYAFAGIAKIMLKQKQDKEALKKAMQAYELEPEAISSVYTLSLAYHFNNNIQERDRFYKKVKSLADADGDYSSANELTDIFNGKTDYR